MQTRSERLFEWVLRRYGLEEWQHHKRYFGTSKRPDYSVQRAGEELVFEVKEFQPTPEDFREGFSFFDPYRPIRKKIEIAGEQLKAPIFRSVPCALVLFNCGKPLVELEPHVVCGAMFGDLGWSIPFHSRTGMQMSEARTRFLERGKLRNEKIQDGRVKRIKPAYRFFSAVVVLEIFSIGQELFHIECCKRRAELGRKESVDEFFDWMRTARNTPHDPARKLLRVSTCYNPFAWKQFPQDLFRGDWDQQHGLSQGYVQRIFGGAEITRLEAELERWERIGRCEPTVQ